MATLLDPSARPSQGGPHEGLVAGIDVGFSQNNSAANLTTSSVQAGSFGTLQFNSANAALTYSLSGTSGGSVASASSESDAHQDLSHVLRGFQHTEDLNSVLHVQQQPELVQGEIDIPHNIPMAVLKFYYAQQFRIQVISVVVELTS